MIAVLDTETTEQYLELMAFVKAKNIKTTWCESKKELRLLEDAALHQLMMEEPKEYVDIESVKDLLKQKINANKG